MTYRRSLTPSPSPQAGGDAAFKQRRADARNEVSERVVLQREGQNEPLLGWALNISRGGVRAILEGKVSLGEDFDVTVGEESKLKRKGRIVWLQEEPDGLIVGVEFLATGQSLLPPPPRDAGFKEATPKSEAAKGITAQGLAAEGAALTDTTLKGLSPRDAAPKEPEKDSTSKKDPANE